jgi:hypothetical protein
MLNKIRQRFFRNKGVNKPSPDEKAYNIGCKLASLLVKKFDFDKVDIVVENPTEINSNSLIYKTLVNLGHLKAMESEILIKQEFFKYTEFKSHFNGSKCERRLITFRLSRKYNQSYEHAYIFATTTENNDNLYFIEKYQDNIFGHYKGERYLKEFGEFESDSFYAYDQQENKISYFIEIPFQYENDTLILMEPDQGFFPLYRSYLVTVKIDIEQQRFSKNTEFRISFGDNILKKHQCEMTNSNDFTYNLLKILYPFNLTDEELNELSLKREQLVNISNCFLNQFNEHYTVKEMENI